MGMLAFLAWGLTFGVCAFAWVKGAAAERYGAVAYALSSLGYLALQLGTGEKAPVLPAVWLDFAVAVTFLVLAVRYNSPWLGAAMMIKGGQMALHATHLTDHADPHFAGFNLYAVGLNLIALAILSLFVAATVSRMRARSRSRPAPAGSA